MIATTTATGAAPFVDSVQAFWRCLFRPASWPARCRFRSWSWLQAEASASVLICFPSPSAPFASASPHKASPLSNQALAQGDSTYGSVVKRIAPTSLNAPFVLPHPQQNALCELLSTRLFPLGTFRSVSLAL